MFVAVSVDNVVEFVAVVLGHDDDVEALVTATAEYLFADVETGIVVLLNGSVELELNLDVDSHVTDAAEKLFVVVAVEHVLDVVSLVIVAVEDLFAFGAVELGYDVEARAIAAAEHLFVDVENGVVVLLIGSVQIVLDLDGDSHVSDAAENLFVVVSVELVYGVVSLVIVAAEHLLVAVETDVVDRLLVAVAAVFVTAVFEHTEHQSSTAGPPIGKDPQYNFAQSGFVLSLTPVVQVLASAAASTVLSSQHFLSQSHRQEVAGLQSQCPIRDQFSDLRRGMPHLKYGKITNF